MDSFEYHRLQSEYQNDIIAAVGHGAGVATGAMSATCGMHHNIASLPPQYEDRPVIYARIVAGKSPEKLDAYLQEELGFVKGKDYLRHNDGVRQPDCYFDFFSSDAIERLESHAMEKGFYAEQEAERQRRQQERNAEADSRLWDRVRREEAEAAKGGWLRRMLQRQAPDKTKGPQK